LSRQRGSITQRSNPHALVQYRYLCLAECPRIGTCGRNTLFGPPLTQFDFSLNRSVNFGEQRRLELRWDVLNAFNTAHFGYPDSEVTDSTFGTITSLAGDPSEMQFALKFYF